MNEENLSRGYIALYRSLLDNPFWTQYPLSYLKVFLYCLLKAAYKPRTWNAGSAKINIPIGAFIDTAGGIAENVGVTRAATRRALAALETGHMVVSKSTNKFTLYTVVNFEAYQNGNLDTGQQTATKPANKRPTNGHQDVTKPATSKEIRNKKEEIPLPEAGVVPPPPKSRKKPTAYPLFDEFWEIASRWNNEDKHEALKSWKRDVKDDETLAREIITAAREQCQTIIDRAIATGYRPAMAVTWLNKKRYQNKLTPLFDAPIPTSPAQLAEKRRKALESYNADREERGLAPVDDFE